MLHSWTLASDSFPFDLMQALAPVQCYACEGGMSLDLKLVRTNLPPRTIMRGPGFLNAVMIIEHIIEHVAIHLGLDPVAVKEINFIRSAAAAAPQPSLASSLL